MVFLSDFIVQGAQPYPVQGRSARSAAVVCGSFPGHHQEGPLLQESLSPEQGQQQPQQSQAGEQGSSSQQPLQYIGHSPAEVEELPELSDEVTVDALR